MSKNQCDGCQAGIPLDEKGIHRVPDKWWGAFYCTKDRYVENTNAKDQNKTQAT